jgi:hypothetical protein
MDRISMLLPNGPSDLSFHRGARRRTARYPVNADVRVVTPPSEGVVINASAGGMRVTLDHAVDAGSIVDLEITFGVERVSRERAKVVWIRALPDGFLAGVEFV